MEVLQHEAGVFRARLLRDLSLHDGHHRGDPHRLIAPAAEGRGRPGTEKLHLGAVLGEGVPGDEEAQHGLLARQAVVLAPGGDIGARGSGFGARGLLAKQGVLAGLPFRLTGLGFGERGVERGHELGAVTAQ